MWIPGVWCAVGDEVTILDRGTVGSSLKLETIADLSVGIVIQQFR